MKDNIEILIEKLKSIKVLYVEDNLDARQSTLILLEDIFRDITVAIDGEDGLEKFKNNKLDNNSKDFDLLITDISMPNMDGLDMSSEIKKIDKDISIVVLTALKDINTVIKAIDIGVDHFINKPLEDFDILFDKLNMVLQKIEYSKVEKEKEKVSVDKEKIDLILKVLKLVGHHWRQPLSTILTISSGCTMLKNAGDEYTTDDLESVEEISNIVMMMDKMLNGIENIDFDNSSIEDIEKIISISNEMIIKDNNNG
jgi:CheY-like chemotaxis protein